MAALPRDQVHTLACCSLFAALLPQAFDDCTTLNSTFKLLDSFEGLLEREAIAAELAKKQVRAGVQG